MIIFRYLDWNRTKKFGPYMKCLLLLILPIPIVLWTIAGLIGNSITGLLVGFGWPFMETFRVISKEGVPIRMRVKRCFTVISCHVLPTCG